MISIGPVNYILPAGDVAAHFKKSESISKKICNQVNAALKDLDTSDIKSSFLAGPIEYNTKTRKNVCATLVLVSCKYDEEQKDLTPIKNLVDIYKLRIVIMSPNDVVMVYPFNIDTKKPSPANYGGIINAAKTFIKNKTLATPVGKDNYFYPKSPVNLKPDPKELKKIDNYIITLKYDGIRMIVVFDENGSPDAYTRNHMKLPVPLVFVRGVDISRSTLPCVFEAEAYCTHDRQEMAHSKMKESNYDNMKFAIFNVWSPDMDIPYLDRHEIAKRCIRPDQSDVHMVTVFDMPIELAIKMQTEIEAKYSEGLVLWKRDELYRKQGGLYKIKWSTREKVVVIKYKLNAAKTFYVLTCQALNRTGEPFDVKLATDDVTFVKLYKILGDKGSVSPFSDILSTVIVTHYGILQKSRRWPTATLEKGLQ